MDTPLSAVLRFKADALAGKPAEPGRVLGATLYWANPETTASEAARLMDESNIGCLMVIDHGHLVGIFSERDLLRGFAREGAAFGARTLAEVMTRKPFTVPPSMTVEQAMVRCTDRRVRHLPVVDGDELLGLISIGDLVRLVVEDKEREIADLINYLHG
jgi:CBS domain-containing protein